LDLAEAFTILAKYNDKECVLNINHHVIYIQINPKKLTNDDMERLKELGWKKDIYYEGVSWVDTTSNEGIKLNEST